MTEQASSAAPTIVYVDDDDDQIIDDEWLDSEEHSHDAALETARRIAMQIRLCQLLLGLLALLALLIAFSWRRYGGAIRRGERAAAAKKVR